jgi:hypothetical protein
MSAVLPRSCEVAALLLAGFILMAIGPRDPRPRGEAAPPDGPAGYRKELLGHLRPYFLLPIMVPSGQTIGDVYSSDFWSLEERAKSCFPTLAASAPEPTTLPVLRPGTTASAGFALGLADVESLGFAGRAVVVFTDVQAMTTSKGELRRALSSDCAYLAPILEERTVGKETPVKIIVGRIVYARKAVFFGMETANAPADAAVLAQRLTALAGARLAPVRVLDAQASAGFDPRARAGVLAELKTPEPVAFAPAFLPKVVMDGFGFNEAGDPIPAIAWKPFDPGTEADDRQWFEALVEALGK